MADDGWGSRKLWLSVFSMILITSVGIACIKYPGILAIYSELVMGVLGILSVYAGGNAFNKWQAAKNSASFVRSNQIDQEEDPQVNDEDQEVGKLP